MKKKTFILIAVLIILAVGLLSLFPRKIKFQETVSACSYDGETISATFDVELWKYWYTEDEMHGTITVDDMVYVSGIEEYPRENWKIDDHIFLVPVKNGLDWLDNFIEIDLVGNSFDAFRMFLKKDETYKVYFCPAENAEEVEAIIGNFE